MFVRVSKEYPCPVCNKPDWCLVNNEGDMAICQRIISDKELGDAGYIHKLEVKSKRIPFVKIIKQGKYKIEWEALNDFYQLQKGRASSYLDLVFGQGKDDGYFTYPMRNEKLEITGIQKINKDKTKFMERGSKIGLFIPMEVGKFVDNKEVLICEGLSDTIAAIGMGLQAIGRASCKTGGVMIVSFMKKRKATHPIIIADNDRPGCIGAEKLQMSLLNEGIKCMMITPPDPIKDLREWRKKGLTKKELCGIIRSNWL